MPNDTTLYKPEDIQPLKERYQDVNKNGIKFLGKVWVNIEYNNAQTNLPLLLTPNYKKNRHITIIRCKLAETITNHYQRHLIEQRNQPIRSSDTYKIQETIRNEPYNQEH